MSIAGIEIICSDDLDIAADRLADLEPATVDCPECHGRGDIWDVSGSAGLINVECPCCLGDGCVLDLDDDGWDPEPPGRAAPALLPCREGGGVGACPRSPQSRCWYCDGRGVVRAAAVPPAASSALDRAAHGRPIAGLRGTPSVAKHGTGWTRATGSAGDRLAIARHGVGTWQGRPVATGWDAPGEPSPPSDLVGGRTLAEPERVA